MPTTTTFIFLDERGFARQPSARWRITFDENRMFVKDEHGHPLRISYRGERAQHAITLLAEQLSPNEGFLEATARYIAFQANLSFERVTRQSTHLFSPDDTARVILESATRATFQLVPLS